MQKKKAREKKQRTKLNSAPPLRSGAALAITQARRSATHDRRCRARLFASCQPPAFKKKPTCYPSTHTRARSGRKARFTPVARRRKNLSASRDQSATAREKRQGLIRTAEKPQPEKAPFLRRA